MLLVLYGFYEDNQRRRSEQKRLRESQAINASIQYELSDSFLDEEEKIEDKVKENDEGLLKSQNEEASESLVET